MGQKIKRENSFDTLLNQSLDKQAHGRPTARYAGKAASRIWPRLHDRLTLSLTILLVIGLGASACACQTCICFSTSSPNCLMSGLFYGLSVNNPDPVFNGY